MDSTASRANLENLVAAQSGRDALANARDGDRNDREGNRGNQHASTGRIAYTLTACCRCRQRKTRCDAGLPHCAPCERSNAPCEYYDTAKGRNIPRSYVIHLRNKAHLLQAELARHEEDDGEEPDAEILIRGAGLVRFQENEESKFLGPSSGIAITRLVMEMAKQNTDTKSIKEVVPDTIAQEIKDRFTRESKKPISKVYPHISAVEAPSLPSLDLTKSLVENFNQKAQYMLPTLHEPTFAKEVRDVYNGSTDPYKNFILRMVIAISIQKMDTQYAGLADSFYLGALSYLEGAVRPMNLGTLQCCALIAQYSLVTPTRTASYWVVGLATRLCQELGITEEETITHDKSGNRLDLLQVEMRRRLFWIITSMEYGLSHSLGRPNAFGTTPDHINVKFFETVDDQYITPRGVRPGSPSSMKKRIAIHFLKMRLLQSEMRRKLYLCKRDEPKDDQDPWFVAMEAKLNDWKESSPRNDEGSGLNGTWFNGRYNTMIVLLFRPSPQVPQPSVKAARLCYDASVFNVYMQRKQIATKSVDLTWIFTQSLFMALNTILWSLSYPEIRQEHPREEVQKHLDTVLEAIRLASERWPGVASALELYTNLVTACLKVYNGSSETSYVVQSPSNRASPASSQDVTTPPPISSPSSIATGSGPSTLPVEHPSPFGYVIGHNNSNPAYSDQVSPSQSPLQLMRQIAPAPALASAPALRQPVQGNGYRAQPSFQFMPSQDPAFDPSSFYNTFPSIMPGLQHWDPNFSSASAPSNTLALAAPTFDPNYYLGSIGEQYSQYLHAPYISEQALQSLNQEQQSELMNCLEMEMQGVAGSDYFGITS